MADVVTNGGRAHIAGLLSNTVSPPANYFIAWGTGAGTAVVGGTSLFTETDARATATASRITTTVTNDTAQFVATLTATAGRNITNAGVWTASSGGVLIQHSDHATVPLLANDSIQYTFRQQIV